MRTHLHSARRALQLGSSALLVVAFILILHLSSTRDRFDLRQSRSASGPSQGATLTVEPHHPGRKFAVGAVGLSIEANELTTQDLNASHASLVALMRQLGRGILRIGGGSVDYSWWTDTNEEPPPWATSKTTPASVVTPAALDRLHRLLTATGWRVILGVDLGHYEPARAASEAHIAERILRSSLLGFELGNDPNDYGIRRVNLRPSSYSVVNYLQEIAAYSAAIRSASPDINLYGPDISLHPWLPIIAANKSVPFTAITQHYYPVSYSFSRGLCKATSTPTALDLLSPQVREEENTFLQTLVNIGQIAHRETRVSETNTTASCDANGGPATSPVFASALWSLDWSLRAASAGITGLNFHGYFGHCAPDTGSPICAPGDVAKSHGQVTARPEYYGLLAARQLEGGDLIPVNAQTQNASGDFTAYATIHPHDVITVAIDNFAPTGTSSFFLKAAGYHKGTSESLAGPSLDATNGVTFGQASFNNAGNLEPTEAKVRAIDGAFRLRLAPESAMVVTLRR